MLKQVLLCLLLSGLLAGCAAARGGLSDEERLALRNSLSSSLLFTVKGVTYAVSRRPEARGGIRVSRQGAYRAAILAYGCQSMSLSETAPVWRVAEGKGAFCEFDRVGGVNR